MEQVFWVLIGLSIFVDTKTDDITVVPPVHSGWNREPFATQGDCERWLSQFVLADVSAYALQKDDIGLVARFRKATPKGFSQSEVRCIRIGKR